MIVVSQFCLIINSCANILMYYSVYNMVHVKLVNIRYNLISYQSVLELANLHYSRSLIEHFLVCILGCSLCCYRSDTTFDNGIVIF